MTLDAEAALVPGPLAFILVQIYATSCGVISSHSERGGGGAGPGAGGMHGLGLHVTK